MPTLCKQNIEIPSVAGHPSVGKMTKKPCIHKRMYHFTRKLRLGKRFGEVDYVWISSVVLCCQFFRHY